MTLRQRSKCSLPTQKLALLQKKSLGLAYVPSFGMINIRETNQAVCLQCQQGEMAEWLKAQHWKCCLGETLTRVRIPLSPYPRKTLKGCQGQSFKVFSLIHLA